MTNHEGNGNMKQGLQYVVTNASDDWTFDVGDHIWICANGDIASQEAQGWIDKADVEGATCGMEVEVDVEWAERMRKNLLQEIAELPYHRAVVQPMTGRTALAIAAILHDYGSNEVQHEAASMLWQQHAEIDRLMQEVRESCASVCEEIGKDIVCPEECAAAIRARGNP